MSRGDLLETEQEMEQTRMVDGAWTGSGTPTTCTYPTKEKGDHNRPSSTTVADRPSEISAATAGQRTRDSSGATYPKMKGVSVGRRSHQ